MDLVELAVHHLMNVGRHCACTENKNASKLIDEQNKSDQVGNFHRVVEEGLGPWNFFRFEITKSVE